MRSEKVLDLWAFQKFDRQHRSEKMTAKTAPWKHINENVRRVVAVVWTAEGKYVL